MPMKTTAFFCFFFACLSTFAQEPKGKGKTTTIKVDGGFNSKVDKVLPDGHWTFTNADDVLCKEGDYSVSGMTSSKAGVWTFYNLDGKPLLKITYKKDVATQIEVLDSGSNDCGSAKIRVETDTSEHYHVYCFELMDVKQFVVNKVPAKVSVSEINAALKANSKAPSGPYGLVVYPALEQPDAPVKFADSMIVKRWPEISKSLIKAAKVEEKQNLVLNSGFEAGYVYKKTEPEGTGKAIWPYWYPARETPDPWRNGKESWAGFRVIGANYEIIGGQLKEALEPGKKYCFQMKIHLKPQNHLAVAHAGLILSQEPLPMQKFAREDFEEHAPVLLSPDSMVLALRQQWQVLSGSFTASEESRFIYIGVFPPGMKPLIYEIDSAAPDDDIRFVNEAYYMVDDVTIRSIDSIGQCPCNLLGCPADTTKPTVTEPAKTKPKQYTFRNIQFETNSATLLEISYYSLDSVLNLLDENPKMKLMITGHTDSEGDSTANQELSENRARAVYDYLVGQGIKAERLQYEGKGETEPVDNNKTSKGRANNRRVTFTVLEE